MWLTVIHPMENSHGNALSPNFFIPGLSILTAKSAMLGAGYVTYFLPCSVVPTKTEYHDNDV
jgi:hypothetical protein